MITWLLACLTLTGLTIVASKQTVPLNYTTAVNLIVDLGQSGSRIKIGDQVTNLLIAKTSSEAITFTVERIFREIKPQVFEKVFLSLTGLQGEVGNPQPYGELCRKFFQSQEVCVMDDGIASYVGALGEKDGVALTLGGGVVAIASINGRFSHADGKGPIFGDFGGGFWIGQNAMQKAIASLDGRDKNYPLVELLAEEIERYNSLDNKTGVEAAQLCIAAAKTVAYGAEQGNESALAILDSGASYLAKTINAAWIKVNNDNNRIPNIAIQGGLSKSQVYVSNICSHLKNLMNFQYVEAIGDHLVGAPLVATKYPSDIAPLMKWWRA